MIEKKVGLKCVTVYLWFSPRVISWFISDMCYSRFPLISQMNERNANTGQIGLCGVGSGWEGKFMR